MKLPLLFGALLAAAGAVSAQEAVSGKVAETMDAGGYTYVRLDQGKGSAWVATRPGKFAKGETLSFSGLLMTGFYSRTLNRKFDRIIFSDGPDSPVPGARGTAGQPAPRAQAGMSGTHGMAPETPAGRRGLAAGAAPSNPMGGYGAQPALAGLKVDRAVGPDAATVAEVFARRAALDGKTVAVRAKVVKVSTGILGRNWVHLQDGTGDKASATHDLLATTSETPKAGEMVTVRGTAAKDKDFGSGYTYPVMLENAVFRR